MCLNKATVVYIIPFLKVFGPLKPYQGRMHVPAFSAPSRMEREVTPYSVER